MNNIFNSTGHELKLDIVKARGVNVTDISGKTYADFESGVWSLPLGHNHEAVNEAIRAQLDKITHAGFCFNSSITQEAALDVLDISGMKDGECVFLCSGSEAVEYSRQAARAISGSGLTLTMSDSYNGSYSSIKPDGEWYLFDWNQCCECDHENEECEHIKAIPENISEFIFEPGSSSGMVRFPPKMMIRRIVDKVRSNGGSIIVNEVTTGIGRTGEWFGFNHYDIEPDFVAIGKGIGNGYPVSVVAMRKVAAEKLKKSGFKYSQSHQNDPMGASVVKSVINTIKSENLIKQAQINGKNFLSELMPLVGLDIVKEIRGRGLMLAIEMIDVDTTKRVYEAMIAEGYLLGNRGSFFRVDPPLITTPDELGKFINIFKKVCS